MADTDRRGKALNGEGDRIYQAAQQMGAQIAQLKARDQALADKARSLEAARRSVRTNADVASLNQRIREHNASVKQLGMDEQNLKVRAEEVKRQIEEYEKRVEDLNRFRQDLEKRLAQVRGRFLDHSARERSSDRGLENAERERTELNGKTQVLRENWKDYDARAKVYQQKVTVQKPAVERPTLPKTNDEELRKAREDARNAEEARQRLLKGVGRP